jgi:hypothetical protein
MAFIADPVDASNKLLQLCQWSKKRDDELQGGEGSYIYILEFLRDNSVHSSDLSKTLVQCIKYPYFVYPELVAYCMHALKWNEVRDQISLELIETSDLRLQSAFRMVLSGYEDDWNDEGYFTYSLEKPGEINC